MGCKERFQTAWSGAHFNMAVFKYSPTASVIPTGLGTIDQILIDEVENVICEDRGS